MSLDNYTYKKNKAMKRIIGLAVIITTIISCVGKTKSDDSKSSQMPIAGTWKLLTGTLIEKGDTVVTDYTKNISFIKIINDTHFAFFQHDLNKGKDSVPVFVSGSGGYSLTDSTYIEHLEYCTARNWEGNDFTFTITIKNDTLIQSGIEKVESAGVNRINIEKYVRVNK
jgi:predicted small secreted protein